MVRTDSDLGQLAAIRAGMGIGVCHIGIGGRDPDLVHLLPEAFKLEFETWAWPMRTCSTCGAYGSPWMH